MIRGLIVFLLVVGLVLADEDNSCSSQDDCDCGFACNDGTCEEGCQVFDQFLAAGSEADVYGRTCECGTEVDAKGLPIMCDEDAKFEGAPDGVKMFTKNKKC